MITLSAILSERCNLNCSYCNVDKLSKKHISVPLFLSEYRKIKNNKPNEKIEIHFFGGEPLLQWGSIKEIVEATKTDGSKFVIPTNGLLLDNKKVDYLNKNNFKVSLSFDGLWQDQNRKQHGGEGTLDRYFAKRDIFKGVNNLSCHTMIYNQENLNLVDNHKYILENFGLNTGMTLIRDRGVWTKKSSLAFNKAFSQLVQWYISNVDNFEMPKLIEEYLRHMILYTVKKKTTDFCGAGTNLFSFAEDRLVPCNRFKSRSDINKIPDFRQMKECQSCVVKNYCKKGCLFENIKNGSPIEELCDMYRHIYADISKMIESLKTNLVFTNYLKEEIYGS